MREFDYLPKVVLLEVYDINAVINGMYLKYRRQKKIFNSIQLIN